MTFELPCVLNVINTKHLAANKYNTWLLLSSLLISHGMASWFQHHGHRMVINKDRAIHCKPGTEVKSGNLNIQN